MPKERLKKWKVLQSQYVEKSPWVNWRVDSCSLPNGAQIDDFHISEVPPGVGVVALTAQDDVILVCQYRHGSRKFMLEIPGGNISPRDRSPLGAARRELLEETGYSSSRWMHLGNLFAHPASQESRIFLYLALNAKQTGMQSLDHSEQIQVKWIPIERVLGMIRSGRVPSLGTVAAILLARARVLQ